MPKEPMKRKVTKKEIDNAIFVDFEGAKTGTNTEPDYSDPNCRKFVGMMWKTNYVNLDQFILEPSLKFVRRSTVMLKKVYVKNTECDGLPLEKMLKVRLSKNCSNGRAD